MFSILTFLVACSDPSSKVDAGSTQPVVTVAIDKAKLAAFKPLPGDFFGDGGDEPNPVLIDLGQRLYGDTILSDGGDVSCNSCHDLATNGAGNTQFSTGHGGTLGGRNAPTVFNAAGQVAQFWDGRAPDVEHQALGPILNPKEMASKDAKSVVKRLKKNADYVAQFKSAFPDQKDPVTFDNVGVAIGAFERTLTKPSRWDKFLNGDDTALTVDERRGVNEFVDAGCTGCHVGPLLGGSLFMKAGIVNPWPNQQDQGKFDLTHNEADRMVFKVPSLRYATETAPYFHDGSVSDLPTAIKMMGHHQLGKELTDEQAASIAAFLGSTSGPAE
jgi:cytochrome c peroxidase